MKLLLALASLVVNTGCCIGFVVPHSTTAGFHSLRAAPSSSWTSSCSIRSLGQGRAAESRVRLRMFDDVGPQFANKLVQEEGWAYVDVRAEHEFEHGRPAGAINIPAFFSTAMGMQTNPEFVNQVAEKFPDKGSKLVLGCLMGSRSAQAAEWLEDAGYEVLVNVEGGYSAWARDDSLPVEV